VAKSQKLPKHHSYSSSTQRGTLDRQPAKRAYTSGNSVHKGRVPRDPDGEMPMAGPDGFHETRRAPDYKK
jgi:hypothetical protein